MVKLIYCISKKPELSVEEFQTLLARDARRRSPARIPGLRRYVQCHTVPELYGRGRRRRSTARRSCGSTTWTRCARRWVAGDEGGAGGREELHRPLARGVVRHHREAGGRVSVTVGSSRENPLPGRHRACCCSTNATGCCCFA